MKEWYEEDDDKIISDIMDDFSSAQTARAKLEKNWEVAYDYYKSKTRRKVKPTQSNLFIPYPKTLVRTIIPRLVKPLLTFNPFFYLLPMTPADVLKAEGMQKLLEYQFSRLKMTKSTVKTLKSALIYGYCPIQVFWHSDKRTIKINNPVRLNGRIMSYEEVEKEVTLMDQPDIMVINPYYFWFDNEADDLDNIKWAIKISYKNKRELLRLQEQGVYENIDDLNPGDFQEIQSHLDIDKSFNTDKIELLEYWTEERVITIANRRTIIRNDPNPLISQRLPFLFAVVDEEIDDVVPDSETMSIKELQEELNTIRNQRMDNVNKILRRTWRADPYSSITKADITNEPDEIIFAGKDEIEPFNIPDVTMSAYREEENVKNDMQAATGVTDFVMGRASNSLNNTATGITSVIEQANARFDTMIKLLEQNLIVDMIKLFIEFNQSFISEDVVIRISDEPTALAFKTVTPEEIAGQFVVKANPATFLNKAVERQQDTQLLQVLANFAQAVPGINFAPLLKHIVKLFEIPNPDAIIPASPQTSWQPQSPNPSSPQGGMPGTQPGAPAPAPGQGPPQPGQSNIPANIPPEVAQAMAKGGQ